MAVKQKKKVQDLNKKVLGMFNISKLAKPETKTKKAKKIVLRDQLYFNITQIYPNSEVLITFSEQFWSINDFRTININATSIHILRKFILNVTYHSQME